MTFTVDELREAIQATADASFPDSISDAIAYFKDFNVKFKQELALCALCSHIGMQYNAQQVEFRKNVEAGQDSWKHLDNVNIALRGLNGKYVGGDKPSQADVTLLHTLIPVFTTVLLPAVRIEHFPNILSWVEKFAENNLDIHLLGKQRIGNQIDMYPDSRVVRKNADRTKEINAGFKKKASQRQKEKAAKAGGSGSEDFKLPPAASSFSYPKERLDAASSVDLLIEKVESCLGIATGIETSHDIVKHEATPDMSSLLKVLDGKEGFKCKNLFLKAKKSRKDVEGDSRMWLVVAPHDAVVEYPKLTKTLGYPPKGDLRQAKADLLEELLGLEPGHVTPFGLLNDPDLKVNVVLEKTMMLKPENKLWFHPLSNEATMCISAKELASFIAASAREPVLIDFAMKEA